MRIAPLALLALIAVGCGPEFAVLPRGGLPRVTVQAPTGPTLTAFADQWSGEPGDLADYVTPVAIELYNPGPYSVRVSYADFVLKNERGQRFVAINPFGGPPMSLLDEPLTLDKSTLLASRGGFHGGGFHGGGFHGGGVRGGVTVIAPSGRRFVPGGGYGYRGFGGWRGFYVAPRLRGFFGPGALYWTAPFLYPPYYSEWVYGWSPSYYPAAQPSPDILALTLPEGVLPPGGRVDGFLLFSKATNRETRNLDLGWEVFDAQTGAPLGTTHVALEVYYR